MSTSHFQIFSRTASACRRMQTRMLPLNWLTQGKESLKAGDRSQDLRLSAMQYPQRATARETSARQGPRGPQSDKHTGQPDLTPNRETLKAARSPRQFQEFTPNASLRTRATMAIGSTSLSGSLGEAHEGQPL